MPTLIFMMLPIKTGMGSLVVESTTSNAISAGGGITINGGIVAATSKSFGIEPYGKGVTKISGGEVTATATGSGGNIWGILSPECLEIRNAKVTARGTSGGIFSKSLTIGNNSDVTVSGEKAINAGHSGNVIIDESGKLVAAGASGKLSVKKQK